jgi:hypothetical protein
MRHDTCEAQALQPAAVVERAISFRLLQQRIKNYRANLRISGACLPEEGVAFRLLGANLSAVIPGRAPISGLPEIGTLMSKSANADLEWARARNP